VVVATCVEEGDVCGNKQYTCCQKTKLHCTMSYEGVEGEESGEREGGGGEQ
jgi:hypothetical protein